MVLSVSCLTQAEPERKAIKREAAKWRHPKWKQDTASRRNMLGMSPSYRPWTQLLQKKLKGVPDCDRIREMLDIIWYERCLMHSEALGMSAQVLAGPAGAQFHQQLCQDLVIDVSQALPRKTAAATGLGCLTQSMVAYVYSMDQVLKGYQHLQLQGWPLAWSQQLAGNPAAATSLAGEGWFLPCISCVLLALWACPGPWWEELGEQFAVPRSECGCPTKRCAPTTGEDRQHDDEPSAKQQARGRSRSPSAASWSSAGEL